MGINRSQRLVKVKYILLCLIFAIVFFVALSNNNRVDFSDYETISIARGYLTKKITARGHVLPAIKESVTVLSSGVIQNIMVKEGQKVFAGQTLLRLEPIIDYEQLILAKQKVVEAKLQLQQAQDELDRVNTLNQFEQITQADLEKIHNKVIQLKELVKINEELFSIKKNLKSEILKAPFAGIVLFNFPLMKGQFLHISNQPISIVSADSFIVEAYLNQDDIQHVSIETEVILRNFDNHSQTNTFSGKVISISPEVRKGLIGICITVENRISFKIGTSLLIEIPIILSSESLLVPIEAVRMIEDKTYVFVAKDNRIEKCEVIIGDNNYNQVEIQTGDSLFDGCQIIVSGFDRLMQNVE